MRRILPWLGGALVATVLGVAFSPKARAVVTDAASAAIAAYVNPAPMAAKHPLKVSLAGTTSACTTFSPAGQNLRVSCTVDCEYDVGTSAPDGGIILTAYPDGGAQLAATADSNQLPAATPETMALTQTQDSVCVYSASAGTAYIAGRYP